MNPRYTGPVERLALSVSRTRGRVVASGFRRHLHDLRLRRSRNSHNAAIFSGVVAGLGLTWELRGHCTSLDSGRSTWDWIGLPTFIRGEDATDAPPNEQSPPSQAPRHQPTKGHVDEQQAADDPNDDIFTSLRKRLANIPHLGDKISDLLLPSWIKVLPGFIRKLQGELSMAPGSLSEEVWSEAHDPECNPEITWNASVRVSRDLCPDEKSFLRQRRMKVKKALALYIDVPEDDIHPDDVPTIAICGSGGGLRAMVAGTSSLLSATEAGLFDCATYTAGVSGSCWAQHLFYSSIGRQSHLHMVEHLKHRLGVHIAFPPDAMSLICSAPTNKYLLSGVVEKMRGLPGADFGLVDIYGLLLAARLLVPKGELGIDYYDLKVSDQRRYVDDGDYPLPIYTAVRHEIPEGEKSDRSSAEIQEKAKNESWFQWFEWTPYEFFCEELEAGIPTWAVGRSFDRGKSVMRENGLYLPELRAPILMGIWGSAFCATLSHYYKEIKPIIAGLAGFKGIDELIAEKDEDLVKLHPFDPATIPNFMANMRDVLPASCPESVHNSSHLQLMDAGMSNNLPIYPLLRPGRGVDIVIAFDASADVRKDNWLQVTEGYVRKREIAGWPMGSGWPPETKTTGEAAEDVKATSSRTVGEAKDDLEAASQARRAGSVDGAEKPGLGYCTVWMGSKEERAASEPRLGGEEGPVQADNGMAVIYFPLLANDSVAGVDPQTSDFLSTWNFVYTGEEVDKVVRLARANFEAGREQTRRTVKAMWERKRRDRLQREDEARASSWALCLTRARQQSQYGDQGDHFS